VSEDTRPRFDSSRRDRDRADWASVLRVGVRQKSVATSSLLVAVKIFEVGNSLVRR
jgi:hypothetical protein